MTLHAIEINNDEEKFQFGRYLCITHLGKNMKIEQVLNS